MQKMYYKTEASVCQRENIKGYGILALRDHLISQPNDPFSRIQVASSFLLRTPTVPAGIILFVGSSVPESPKFAIL
jgi:hypothetical protein